MKGNKKLLVLAVLVLLLTVVFSTYAIYRSSNTAGGKVSAAAWSVKIGEDDLEDVTLLFDADDLVCTGTGNYTASRVEGKIAPDSHCTIPITIDADGSEVDVLLTASLGQATLPTGMSVALASGSDSKTIPYSATDGAMEDTITLEVTWTGSTSDASSKDETDLGVAGTDITIPVTLTARQNLSNE